MPPSLMLSQNIGRTVSKSPPKMSEIRKRMNISPSKPSPNTPKISGLTLAL